MQTKLLAMRRARSSQSGFTLVEIAIVLVIIGLLLGGVLKGQELIENGRVKSAANDMNGIMTAHISYFDRFRRLPGDDGPTLPTLTNRGGKWAGVTQFGDNNGVILSAMANTFNGGAAEGVGYFQHLRAAGFINGDPALAAALALPVNPWGGHIGIANDAAIQARPAAATVLVVCMDNVPGKAARALDVQFDDGIPNSGSFRANAGTVNSIPTAAAAAVYDDTLYYTVCRDNT